MEFPSKLIRIRDNGSIKELHFPDGMLEVLQKSLASPRITDATKNQLIRKLTGVSACCICDGIPFYQVNYPFEGGGATRIERYCKKCIEKVYAREQVL